MEDFSNKVQIKVFGVNNKLVHVDEFAPDMVYSFGDKLQSGVYIVHVTQGKNTASERVIKY